MIITARLSGLWMLRTSSRRAPTRVGPSTEFTILLRITSKFYFCQNCAQFISSCPGRFIWILLLRWLKVQFLDLMPQYLPMDKQAAVRFNFICIPTLLLCRPVQVKLTPSQKNPSDLAGLSVFSSFVRPSTNGKRLPTDPLEKEEREEEMAVPVP